VTEDKATVYHRLRRRAELGGTIVAGVLLVALTATGGAVRLREIASNAGQLTPGFEEPVTVVVAALLFFGLLALLEIPFAFYQGYTLEHRYALSNQAPRQWSADQAKGVALGAIFTCLGASIVYALIAWNRDWWWLAAAVVFAVLMIGLAQIAPVALMPLFYRFTPLDRPALVDRLMTLADRAHTPVVGVYEWALSAHTKKANAALTGIGRTRRILLADTLLADYSEDEIEVVLAHELSHHVHHDLWRGMALQAAVLLAGFLAAHLALRAFADSAGLRGLDDAAGLPILLLAAGAVSLLSTPIINALSRAHERRADRYALDATRRPDAFISAMKRLAQQNLAEDDPSELVQWLFYSHPPIRQRIEAARAWATANARQKVGNEVA
jgi:Zn-dependent protease with chaperone function